MPPAESNGAPTRNVAAKSNAPPAVQEVAIISSPAGATVTMDDRADAVCRTPCRLDAVSGRHRITFVLPGYGVERREFDVGTEALELPSVILRAQTGTLAVNTVPKGASIQLNGKKIDQLTPVMLPLAPGSYKITLEKDGLQSTTTVEIRTGDIKHLSITLGQ